MTGNPTVSIIIVSWNVSEFLRTCVQSIFEKSDISAEIIIIDNASRDSTSKILIEMSQRAKTLSFPLTIFQNSINEGFALANNRGIIASRGKYILLLNPDTEIYPGVLSSMIDFFENHPDCGIAGCKHINTDGSVQPSVRRFPRLSDQLIILLKFHRLFSNGIIYKYLVKDFDYSKTQEVEQVAGSFFMFSRRVIEFLGVLDESFYMWFEEVDYCKRLQKTPLKVYYLAEAKILHYGGQSFLKEKTRKKQRVFNASMRRYFLKHHGIFPFFILLLFHPISMMLVFVSQKRNEYIHKRYY